VAYIGARNAAEVVVDGLRRLEYRGYDSAGVVVAGEAPGLQVMKRAGKLRVLEAALSDAPLHGAVALGHTRWATHGRPNDANAHPHVSEDGQLAIIHNGIIENYLALREALSARGHTFASETDSEVLVHLIEEAYAGDLLQALRAALQQVRGAFAVVAMHRDHPEVIAARQTSPLVVGLGEGEQFLASDVPALLPYTRRVIYLHDGEVVRLTREGVQLSDLSGAPVVRAPEWIDWDAEAAEKDGHPHYMLKEMLEQPNVLQQTLTGRFSDLGHDALPELRLDVAGIDRVVITAAGTAAYAGMVGGQLIEALARLPVSVEVASEFRYRNPVIDARTLVVGVSQSGETIDTLEAVREARRLGARTVAVLNVKGSSLAREVDDVLYIHAGPEIGVASTKAYTGMLAALALLAVHLGHARHRLSDARAEALTNGLRALPLLLKEALLSRGGAQALAPRLARAQSVLYLGRGVNVASAYEGALKLKEISYIHAEAYPMGEMKHGPIALIDASVPVVAIATAGAQLEKTLSNLAEVRAREGYVIAIASEGDARVAAYADAVIEVPVVDELLSPILNVVPLQFLAYETALLLGRDVDQPRNLAKSVTVE
jgi:glucosamine--fructose-6-phosphate aminotransferase (isomerizing)